MSGKAVAVVEEGTRFRLSVDRGDMGGEDAESAALVVLFCAPDKTDAVEELAGCKPSTVADPK